jgi:hypothetical protein
LRNTQRPELVKTLGKKLENAKEEGKKEGKRMKGKKERNYPSNRS